MTRSRFDILFVCNGDNARAPLAAECMRGLVKADDHGVIWTVTSAGTEAAGSGWVRPEALKSGMTIGADLADHTPTLLTQELCDSPDLVLAMGWEQISQIWSLVPGAWDKVFTVKEFVHWAKRAPTRPPILFSNAGEQMRDKVVQAHSIRKRARADHGFWGGIRPQDLNLIEPLGKGDEAWDALARAIHALTSDVVTLLTGPQPPKVKPAARPARAKPRTRAKAKARR